MIAEETSFMSLKTTLSLVLLLISLTYAYAQPILGQKDNHTLAQELKSEDAEVRFHAVRDMMMGRLFQSSAQLKEILADRDGNVRIQGMLALGGVNDANKLALLTSALGDENLDVRMLAVRMLADSGEMGISVLERVLEPKDSRLCILAVETLQKTGWKPHTVREQVLTLIVGNDKDGLRKIGSPAVPTLIEIAGNMQWGSQGRQQRAFILLGEMADNRALPFLVKSLKESDLRMDAVKALNDFGAYKLIKILGILGLAVLLAIRAGYSLFLLVLRAKCSFRSGETEGEKPRSMFRKFTEQIINLDMLITLLIFGSAALLVACSNVAPALTSYSPDVAPLFFPAVVILVIFDAVRLSIWFTRRHKPAGSVDPWLSGVWKWLRAGTGLALAGMLILDVALGDYVLIASQEVPQGQRSVATSENTLSEPELSETEKQKFEAVASLAATAAANLKSVYLNEYQRKEAVTSFVKLVSIRSPSRHEVEVRAYLKEQLSFLGARELECGAGQPGAPLNLVMELPATKGYEDCPALLLSAHMDTTPFGGCRPATITFDQQNGDFYSLTENSFGADDKAGVAVILEAVRVAQNNFWRKGAGHCRVIVVFTAGEEEGLVGAKYLAEHYRHLFSDLEISFNFDGYLPAKSAEKTPLVMHLLKGNENDFKYRKAVGHIKDFAAQTGTNTKIYPGRGIGRYYGDGTAFPPEAFRAMGFASPYRGDHSSERVSPVDLIDYTDMLVHLILNLGPKRVALNR